ncbi:polyprenyl synthetase family protein [Streptomyces sp. AM 3-1-1]|uniref:polyprenyl synthetase family protein n=1 Tax=Streptomyces sp. AM 3-1-1 TaxID=3028711 RepID=UPI0023BA0A66|nr:polyprenyl synthetase family protein [Streptomyces sp. AM 3-1-1]WEH31453.1 polyprenyl synthetase family protein [Streptomyces sp. AM 3-1-1]
MVRAQEQPPDWRVVDARPSAAVAEVLERLLAPRVAEAARLDASFGRQVAQWLAATTRGGGRRLRSAFVWWGLRVACPAPPPGTVAAALTMGAAVELLQSCALVQDDVMDNSPVRRGQPALHVLLGSTRPAAAGPGALGFGRSAAVLAGDLAMVWAEDTFADAHPPPEVAAPVRRLWSVLRTEMIAGQYLDLAGQADASHSATHALRTAVLKSGRYSVARPLELGALLAAAPPEVCRVLRAAGGAAGLAFQLRDDLLAVWGDPAHTGKPTGEDIREGKPTLLAALGFSRAAARPRGAALAVLRRCYGNPAAGPAELAAVREVLEETGARRDVEAHIARLVGRASAHVEALPEAPDARARLLALVRLAAGTVAPADAPPAPAPAHPRPARGGSGPGHAAPQAPGPVRPAGPQRPDPEDRTRPHARAAAPHGRRPLRPAAPTPPGTHPNPSPAEEPS